MSLASMRINAHVIPQRSSCYACDCSRRLMHLSKVRRDRIRINLRMLLTPYNRMMEV